MICLPKTNSPHRSNRRSRARTNPNRPWAVPAGDANRFVDDAPSMAPARSMAAALFLTIFKGV